MWCNIFTRQIAETYKIKQLLAVKNRYFRKAGLRLWRHRPEIGAVKISKNQQESGEIGVWSSQQTKKMVILKFIKTESGPAFTSHTLCFSVVVEVVRLELKSRMLFRSDISSNKSSHFWKWQQFSKMLCLYRFSNHFQKCPTKEKYTGIYGKGQLTQ